MRPACAKDQRVHDSQVAGSLTGAFQSVGLAAICFVLALVIDGPHPGDAAAAAVVATSAVGPAGSSSLSSELVSIAQAMRALVFGRVGQESAQ